MIKMEHTNVMNIAAAIRGMRNPMQSWEKSDSYTDSEGNFVLGPEDLNLAQRLCMAGSDERKFMRQIFVSVDITAPLYWWKEYDTYKVGTVANSTSTMHKIHAKPFEIEDFSGERLSQEGRAYLYQIIDVLEKRRQVFVETKDRAAWDDMIQLLPTSFNQMRTCTMNYENLVNMYFARRNHKLAEWREFCQWIEGLPYFCDIVGSRYRWN